MHPIKVKRVYEPSGPEDGCRVLVDRVWPRGMKKEAPQIDEWNKDVAPSAGLRRWFGHEPARWEEFQRRFTDELDGNPDAWRLLVEKARSTTVTLVYSARDERHNNAIALKEYLEAKL